MTTEPEIYRKGVAQSLIFGLNWKTVKNIDKRSLERRLKPVDLTGVRVIGMDEFAI